MIVRPTRLLIAATLGCSALRPMPAPAAPANTLKALWTELGECLKASAATEGADLTIVFTIDRTGALWGKPRLSHAKWPDEADAGRRIAGSVARALDRCLPLSITDSLGGAVAGRPLTIRLVGRKKGADT